MRVLLWTMNRDILETYGMKSYTRVDHVFGMKTWTKCWIIGSLPHGGMTHPATLLVSGL